MYHTIYFMYHRPIHIFIKLYIYIRIYKKKNIEKTKVT